MVIESRKCNACCFRDGPKELVKAQGFFKGRAICHDITQELCTFSLSEGGTGGERGDAMGE